MLLSVYAKLCIIVQFDHAPTGMFAFIFTWKRKNEEISLEGCFLNTTIA